MIDCNQTRNLNFHNKYDNCLNSKQIFKAETYFLSNKLMCYLKIIHARVNRILTFKFCVFITLSMTTLWSVSGKTSEHFNSIWLRLLSLQDFKYNGLHYYR